jgi:hypothetical protein
MQVCENAHSSGGGLTLWAVTDTGARLSGSALLELPSELRRGGRGRHRGRGRGRGGGARGSSPRVGSSGGTRGGEGQLAGTALAARLGELGQAVGRSAVGQLVVELGHGGAVDEWTSDQLVIFMALAQGRSCMLTGPLSMHAKTAMHFASTLCGARFNVTAISSTSNGDDDDGEAALGDTCIVECDGIGWSASLGRQRALHSKPISSKGQGGLSSQAK